MRALTVEPLRAGSVRVGEVPDPVAGVGELLVQGLAVGVCGTGREIAGGGYGWALPGRDRLVLGHESLGRVLTAAPGSGFGVGDLVVGVVRRPDPVPCGACAQGEFDMCRNGGCTERGIKQLDGFGSQWWTVEAGYAVAVDAGSARTGMLLEPASVVVKAWDQIEKVGRRSWFDPQRVVVCGAGPVGLLATLLGGQRGLEVHVLDVAVSGGAKPALVAALGAQYHTKPMGEVAAAVRPDIVIEATGVPQVVFEAMTGNAAYGVVCLTGVSPVGRTIAVDVGSANREMVLENDVVVGSVNADLGHYAAAALVQADTDWLAGLITRRLPLDRFAEALEPGPGDITVVLDLT